MLDALLHASVALTSLSGAAVDAASSDLPFYTRLLQSFGEFVAWAGNSFSQVLWRASWSAEFFRGGIFKQAVQGLQVFLTFFGAALLVAGRRGWWMVVGAGLLLGGCGLIADAVHRVGTLGALAAGVGIVGAGAAATVLFLVGKQRRSEAVFWLVVLGGAVLLIGHRGPLDLLLAVALLLGSLLAGKLDSGRQETSKARLGFWMTGAIGAAVWVGSIVLMYAVSAAANGWQETAASHIPDSVAVLGLSLAAVGMIFGGLGVLNLKGTRPSKRLMVPLWVFMSLLSVGSYYNFGNPHVRYGEYYHRHEFFHYYVGSKYFDELGYKLIYECAAVAEQEDGKLGNPKTREIRDLRVNLIKTISDTAVVSDPKGLCVDRFGERWGEFKQDIAWFRNSAHGGDYWKSMWKDHGYNPPPVWTMEGRALASLTGANSSGFLALSMIDVALQLAALMLVFWAFGWQVGAIAAVFWGCNAPADFYWTGGAFLRQDWYFLVVAAVCLARKRLFWLSGAALTWAALLRVFPAMLFAGWAMIILFDLVRSHTKAPLFSGNIFKNLFQAIHPDHRRLIGGCLLACAVLIPSSIAVAGTHAYPRFWEHIHTHKDTPLTNHMGLPTILSHTWKGRMMAARNDTLDDPFEEWKAGRTERSKSMKAVQYGIVFLMLAGIAWCLRRTKLLWVAVPLSVGVVPGMLNLTCYYFSMYVVIAVLARGRPALGAALLIASGASQIMHQSYHFFDDRFTADSWLFMVLSFLVLFAYSRPVSLERLKRWWKGKTETARPSLPGAT